MSGGRTLEDLEKIQRDSEADFENPGWETEANLKNNPRPGDGMRVLVANEDSRQLAIELAPDDVEVVLGLPRSCQRLEGICR